MSKLFAAVVAAIVGWFGPALLLAPALAAPAPTIHTYAYDEHHSASNIIGQASERGPPGGDGSTSFHDAIGRWSRGASARVNATARFSVSVYDRAHWPVRLDSASGRRASSVGGVTRGDPSAFAATGVAAKTGTSALDALSPAIRSNVDDAIERGGWEGPLPRS